MFGRKFFYSCKFISSEIGFNQKFSSKSFWSKIFWFENYFLGNGFEPKNFIGISMVENILLMQNHFLGNRFEAKIKIDKFFGHKFFIFSEQVPGEWVWTQAFLWLQYNFRGNGFEPKNFIEIFLVKIFDGYKMISTEIDLNLNIFMENFIDQNFLWLQNHFLGNRIQPEIFIQKFYGRKFFLRKIISSGMCLNKKFTSNFFVKNFL